MKKILASVLLCLAITANLTACGTDTEDSAKTEDISSEASEAKEAINELAEAAANLEDEEEEREKCAQENQEQIEQILADKDSYPSITDITVNEDFSEYTVTTTCHSTDEFTEDEEMLGFDFTLAGTTYQWYMDNPPEKTVVKYINDSTGEIFAIYDSSQQGEE